jgi:hypothetical protein
VGLGFLGRGVVDLEGVGWEEVEAAVAAEAGGAEAVVAGADIVGALVVRVAGVCPRRSICRSVNCGCKLCRLVIIAVRRRSFLTLRRYLATRGRRGIFAWAGGKLPFPIVNGT